MQSEHFPDNSSSMALFSELLQELPLLMPLTRQKPSFTFCQLKNSQGSFARKCQAKAFAAQHCGFMYLGTWIAFTYWRTTSCPASKLRNLQPLGFKSLRTRPWAVRTPVANRYASEMVSFSRGQLRIVDVEALHKGPHACFAALVTRSTYWPGPGFLLTKIYCWRQAWACTEASTWQALSFQTSHHLNTTTLQVGRLFQRHSLSVTFLMSLLTTTAQRSSYLFHRTSDMRLILAERADSQLSWGCHHCNSGSAWMARSARMRNL